jgi:predicted lipid-binding transport protein (Tim44 family)
MTIGHILTSLGGLVVGIAATYVTFYLWGALARREQITKSLADFYGPAATAYYAASDMDPGEEQTNQKKATQPQQPRTNKQNDAIFETGGGSSTVSSSHHNGSVPSNSLPAVTQGPSSAGSPAVASVNPSRP